MTASKTIHLLELSNMKMTANCFSNSSAGRLLEKVIENNYEMFLHKMSMRKPFFSKATCSLTKEEVLHILFPWEFWKTFSKKTKTFRKIINTTCFDEYFYTYVLEVNKTCRSCPRRSFLKCSEQMYNSESFERYFEFCPRLIWQSCSCLISFRSFDVIWWKRKDGVFPELLTQPIAT